jgi:hypothetical protein
MKRNGSITSRNTTPDSRTTMLNSRPRSVVKVMSPNPSVVITTSVQYRPVIHECCCPSTLIMMR